MAMTAAPISVIIPTLNEEKYIESLLKSLKPQLKRGDEIVVVDSYSADNTVKLARKYTKRIRFMPRAGIGPARTVGARYANNDVVAFLDADTVVPPGWLAKVRTAFLNGADVFYGYAFFSTESLFEQKIHEILIRLQYIFFDMANIFGIKWVSPNNCAFRTLVFMKAGGYGPVVCEDWDLAIRMKNIAGLTYCFDGTSVVYISCRRFKKEGIFRTVGMWAVQGINIVVKRKASSSKSYRMVR